MANRKNRRHRTRTFMLTNGVYGYTVHVRIGGTVEQAEQWAAKILNVPSLQSRQATHAVTFTRDGEKDHCMWFQDHLPGAAAVSHEALHSVAHVMQVIAMPPLKNDHNGEAYCYLLDWLVRCIGARTWGQQ